MLCMGSNDAREMNCVCVAEANDCDIWAHRRANRGVRMTAEFDRG